MSWEFPVNRVMTARYDVLVWAAWHGLFGEEESPLEFGGVKGFRVCRARCFTKPFFAPVAGTMLHSKALGIGA